MLILMWLLLLLVAVSVACSLDCCDCYLLWQKINHNRRLRITFPPSLQCLVPAYWKMLDFFGWKDGKQSILRMQKFGGDVVHLHKIFHFLNSTNPEGVVDLKGVNHVLFFSSKKHQFLLLIQLSTMCWFYMGIAQIALDPLPSVKRANVENKSAPKPSYTYLFREL